MYCLHVFGVLVHELLAGCKLYKACVESLKLILKPIHSPVVLLAQLISTVHVDQNIQHHHIVPMISSISHLHQSSAVSITEPLWLICILTRLTLIQV